jgi:mRNA interferase MazF
MKFKIVLINFPFDDFTESKLRPALCLTEVISKHNQIILAAITSNLNNATEVTDIIIKNTEVDFEKTGLKVSSVIKIHRLLTVSDKIIEKTIGDLPELYREKVYKKIRLLFNTTSKYFLSSNYF